MHLEEGVTLRELSEQFHIHPSNIKYYVDLYKKHGEDIFVNEGKPLYMKSSLEFSCHVSTPEYDCSGEQNDTDHKTDCPCERHIGLYKITDDTRHDPHEHSREKVGHRIAVFVYHSKHKIRSDYSRQRTRHHQIYSYLHES